MDDLELLKALRHHVLEGHWVPWPGNREVTCVGNKAVDLLGIDVDEAYWRTSVLMGLTPKSLTQTGLGDWNDVQTEASMLLALDEAIERIQPRVAVTA